VREENVPQIRLPASLIVLAFAADALARIRLRMKRIKRSHFKTDDEFVETLRARGTTGSTKQARRLSGSAKRESRQLRPCSIWRRGVHNSSLVCLQDEVMRLGARAVAEIAKIFDRLQHRKTNLYVAMHHATSQSSQKFLNRFAFPSRAEIKCE
jgi:hypothetical protein